MSVWFPRPGRMMLQRPTSGGIFSIYAGSITKTLYFKRLCAMRYTGSTTDVDTHASLLTHRAPTEVGVETTDNPFLSTPPKTLGLDPLLGPGHRVEGYSAKPRVIEPAVPIRSALPDPPPNRPKGVIRLSQRTKHSPIFPETKGFTDVSV